MSNIKTDRIGLRRSNDRPSVGLRARSKARRRELVANCHKDLILIIRLVRKVLKRLCSNSLSIQETNRG